ncbi:semaphorin-1A-like isoform X2 [Acanthaster planci]|nr:semaphorin-1A-like isoform X2 [Acanthaster planci]
MGCEFCGGNYIRIIQPLPDGSLLECGTNSLVPYCQKRSTKNLSSVGERQTFDGHNVVPSLPHQNSSWLLLGDSETTNQIFVGSYLVNSFGVLEEPAILRAVLREPLGRIDVQLKTKDSPHTVLNGPQFVGDPIEYQDKIFFFFREFASEHMNSGRIVYSRVSMVCKDEMGGREYTTLTEKHFVTFVKARLECSLPGKYPYYYNEIQDVYRSTVDPNVVYAVFATRSPGVASSAVCAYRLNEIEDLFWESNFLAQKKDKELWLEYFEDVNNEELFSPRQATCPNTRAYTDEECRKILALGQLVYRKAQNSFPYENQGPSFHRRRNRISPLLVTHGERFTQIVVDEGVVDSVDVMFIGTENGTVLKAYLSSDGSEARIVEEISLNSEGLKAPVLTMVKSEASQAVFVGTDIGVYKVPFQHCQDYTTCQSCLDSRDPYCRWTGNSCSSGRTDGLQDLENGSSDLCPDNKDDKILFRTLPKSQSRAVNFPNHPVNLHLVAEAPRGRNLRPVGVDCSPCASLPFTHFRSACDRREFLVMHIDGSSAGTDDCFCSTVLEMDGGVRASANFSLTADSSDPVHASKRDLEELATFDVEMAQYKYELQEWKSIVAKSCELRDLQVCPLGGCSNP